MQAALKITNLKKTYDGKIHALKGIDLEVEQGDFFALLGANGAGKSTAIGIVCSLVNKTAGEIEVFGHNLETDREKAQECLGLVPQEFNFNVWEPVQEILVNQAGYYGIDRTTAMARSEDLLKSLEIWDKRHEQANKLSGGMKRRLMIARALIHKPKLLILDEPTAGVDIEIRRSMWKFLSELNAQGTTIILTTHYLEEAESMCNNVAIINKGEVVESTSMRRLLARLSIETFVLDLKECLDDLPEIEGIELRRLDDNCLEADIDKSRSLNFLFEKLSEHDIRVLSMRNKSNRLEELFIGLVENGKQPIESQTTFNPASEVSV